MTEVKSPFDILKAVNKKDDVRDAEGFGKAYTPFIVNKAFANTKDTVLFANEMNMRASLDKDMQYDFYFYGVLKNPRRFGKWHKKQDQDNLDLIQRHYCVNMQRAEGILARLTKEQVEQIKEMYYEGGSSRKKSK